MVMLISLENAEFFGNCASITTLWQQGALVATERVQLVGPIPCLVFDFNFLQVLPFSVFYACIWVVSI